MVIKENLMIASINIMLSALTVFCISCIFFRSEGIVDTICYVFVALMMVYNLLLLNGQTILNWLYILKEKWSNDV